MQPLYYEESGKINPFRQVIAFTVGILLALVLGITYTYSLALMPVVYLNLVSTIGFSLILGFCMLLLARLSHNRNKRSLIIQTVIITLAAYYFHWVVYIQTVTHIHPPGFGEYLSNLGLLFSGDFFSSIATINHYGAWSVFGIHFNGWLLSLVWLIEAIILFTGPIGAVIRNKIYPYSENTSRWYPKYTLTRDFESVVANEDFLSQLSQNAVQCIKELQTGIATRHTKIHLFYLKEEDYQYLTFEKITIEQQGKGARNSNIVINNFRIDRITAEAILAEFPHSKERVKVF